MELQLANDSEAPGRLLRPASRREGSLDRLAKQRPDEFQQQEGGEMNGDVDMDGAIMCARADLAEFHRMAARSPLGHRALAAYASRIDELVRLAETRTLAERTAEKWIERHAPTKDGAGGGC